MIRASALLAVLLHAFTAFAQPATGEARLKAMNIAFTPVNMVLFAGQGDAAVVDAFLEAGMNPAVVEPKYGASALVNAAANGHLRIVARLLAAGAPVDQPDRLGTTALVAAAYGGKAPVVDLLLSKGANPNAIPGSRVLSPLRAAIANNNAAIAQALIKAGADPIGTGAEVPPLVTAAYAGRVELLKLLLAAKPPLSVVRQALRAAEDAKHPQALALLDEAFKR